MTLSSPSATIGIVVFGQLSELATSGYELAVFFFTGLFGSAHYTNSVDTATEGADMKGTNSGTPALSGSVPQVPRTAMSQGESKRSSEAL